MPVLLDDPTSLSMFDVVQANAAGTVDGTINVTERLAKPNSVYRCQLQDRALWRTKFERPIFSLAVRSAGSILGSIGSCIPSFRFDDVLGRTGWMMGCEALSD